MSPRPFRILGLQQIAIGALSKQPLLELWSDLLGLEVRAEFESVSENVSEAILELGVGPTRVELDLMQPLDPDAKPKVHEPALNHVGLWVDDLAAAQHRKDALIRAEPVSFVVGADNILNRLPDRRILSTRHGRDEWYAVINITMRQKEVVHLRAGGARCIVLGTLRARRRYYTREWAQQGQDQEAGEKPQSGEEDERSMAVMRSS